MALALRFFFCPSCGAMFFHGNAEKKCRVCCLRGELMEAKVVPTAAGWLEVVVKQAVSGD